MQNELYVQFDDLFKKAWEEDVTEFVGEGLYCLCSDILDHVFEILLSCAKSSNLLFLNKILQRAVLSFGQIGFTNEQFIWNNGYSASRSTFVACLTPSRSNITEVPNLLNIKQFKQIKT